MKTRIYITEEILNPGRQSHDYPPTEYTDWQRARGHMTGTVPLRSLKQARAEKLAPCVCGDAACGPEKDMDTGMPVVWCLACGRRILCMNKSDAITLWNAAMRGLSMEGKEK